MFGGVGSIPVPSCLLFWYEQGVEAVSLNSMLCELISYLQPCVAWSLVLWLSILLAFQGRIVSSSGRYTLGGLNSISIT